MSKIAISGDFLTSFMKVNRSNQKKVREFIEKFRENPQHPGINYEKLKTKDGNLYSARVDQAYRVIIVRAPKDDIYILAWVDNHDDAYTWAERHCYQVNPSTGALQVVGTSQEEAAVPEPIQKSQETQTPLYENLKPRQLMRLGVPEALVEDVKAITSETQLDAFENRLPQEAYEALFYILSGENYESIVNDLEQQQDEENIDTENFKVALANADSKRRFYVVEDALELQEILNAPLDKWRVFLHPSQRKLVEKEKFNGPVRVLGGPGTGKTVVAMHRAKYLAQKVFNSKNDKVLFITFTKNLAADILYNLTKICSTDVIKRIEVCNIDRWVSDFLRQHNVHSTPVFGGKDDHKEFWANAYNLDPTEGTLTREFYQEEWEEIIQAQGITSWQEYMKASRTGRGRSISRKMKKEIWVVFEEYRSQLNENGKKEFVDLIRDARELIETKKLTLPYRSVIVDEAQDMGMEAFKLIRTIVPSVDPSTDKPSGNDIFLVGDAHQRIYRHKVTLSKCGINIRGRGRRLKINYRTTDEIRKWAVNLIEGRSIDDLDGEADTIKGYKSLMHGPAPDVKNFPSFNEEVKEIITHINQVTDDGKNLDNICLVARTNKIIDAYKKALEDKNIKTQMIKRNATDDTRSKGLRLATMHRVKGLEFDHIIIASVNDQIVPLSYNNQTFDNETSEEEYGTMERALLYVAVTRAKKSALITSYGKKSDLI